MLLLHNYYVIAVHNSRSRNKNVVHGINNVLFVDFDVFPSSFCQVLLQIYHSLEPQASASEGPDIQQEGAQQPKI